MDNRDRILNEALQLFSEKGYHAVGIQEIVRKSEITKPTLYHYFGNKEGLYLSVLERDFQPLLEGLETLCSEEGDIFAKMKNILLYMMRKGENNRSFFHIFLTLSFAPPFSEEERIGGKYIRHCEQILEDLFIDASFSHGNMRGRHRNYSATFLGFINSSVSRLLKGEVGINDDFIHLIVHQFAHGIYS